MTEWTVKQECWAEPIPSPFGEAPEGWVRHRNLLGFSLLRNGKPTEVSRIADKEAFHRKAAALIDFERAKLSYREAERGCKNERVRGIWDTIG